MRSSGVSPHKRYGARLEFGCKTSEGWSEQRDGHSLVSTGEARRPERARCALGWQRPLEEGVRLRVLRAALGRWKRETLETLRWIARWSRRARVLLGVC